jgi:hypothetical protein
MRITLMKIYKSYQKAFLFEIIIGLLTLFTVVLWGVLGLLFWHYSDLDPSSLRLSINR